MMATDDTSRAVVVVVVGGCRCLIHPLFVLVLVVLVLVLPPKYYWSHHAYSANKVDTKNIVRQVSLHRAAHCDQTTQDVFKSRQNVVGQILHKTQLWAFRLPLLVGHILHLHSRQCTGMITSLG